MKKKPAPKTKTVVMKARAPRGANAFGEVLDLIQSARRRVYQAVNAGLVALYWQIGEHISRKVASEGWGEATIEKLSAFIQRSQPGLRGFSAPNLWRMRQFYEAYRDQPILSPLVRELPWTHHLLILGHSKQAEEREFYLRLAIREKWGKRELERQLRAGRFERAITNPVKVSPLVRELHPVLPD